MLTTPSRHLGLLSVLTGVLISALVPVWAQNACNTTEPIQVDLAADISVEEAQQDEVDRNRVTVAGTTNLPDGFEVNVVTCRYYLGADGNRYCLRPVRILAAVDEGQFDAEFLIVNKPTLTAAVEAYAQSSGDAAAQQATIDDQLTIKLVGTPRAQSESIQCLIGGPDSTLLQGPHSREATLGFTVVEREYTLSLPL